MRKKQFLLLAVAVLAFSACQKDSDYESGARSMSLTATVEQQSEQGASKTYLDGGLVKWSEEDAIKVFYTGDNAYKFNLTSGANKTNASFSSEGEVTGNPQYAIYPYSAGASISGSNITFTLPATQTYVENSFGNGANVAVAKVTVSGMNFKNVCGVLKISLKGLGIVDKIVLTGNANEKLNGEFTVDASLSTPSATTTTTSTESEKSITLDCSASSLLLGSTAKDFFFVVPVGAFSTSGFTATAYGPNDKVLDVELIGSNTNVINRSSVRGMPTKDVNGFVLPSGYKTLEYIEANGGDLTGYTAGDYAYIDCGCHFLFGDHFLFKYSKVRSISFEDKGYGATYNNTSDCITGGGRRPTGSTSLGNYYLGANYYFSPNVKVDDVYGHIMIEEWTMTDGHIHTILNDLTSNIQYVVDAYSKNIKSNYDSGRNIFIFKNSSVDYPYPSNTKLFYTFLQRLDGSYAFIYQPALNTSVTPNKPGVFDLVTGTFLVNQGTGADFTYPTPGE